MSNYGIDLDGDELDGPSIDRRTTLKLLGAVGATSLAGYARPRPETLPSAQQRGGRLTAGWFEGEISRLDPQYISVSSWAQITGNIFNGLTKIDENLQITGDLATDWTVENDATRFVFQLRDDVTFHNGEQFTAEDVRYTIRRNQEEETPTLPDIQAVEQWDEGGVNVRDDYTVEINLSEPQASFLYYVRRNEGPVTIVNRTALEEMGQEQYALTPVGTGAFEVTGHELGSQITLDAFDDYFETDEQGNQLPYLDGVDINPIPEPATMVNALQSGDIDFAQLLPHERTSDVEGSAGVDLLRAQGIGWLGLNMNEQSDELPFDDPNVRVGIAKLINREQFAQAAYFGNGVPDVGPFPPSIDWVWRDDKPSAQDFDPEEGQRLLEEAGATGLSFDILTTSADLRSAEVLRNLLNEQGLDVSINQVTSSTYWDRFQNLNYDTTISGIVGEPDPGALVYNSFSTDGVWNWTGYSNENVDNWLAEQRSAPSQERRAELLQQVEDELIETGATAFLVHVDDIGAKRQRVNGYTVIPKVRNFHRVWLAE